MPTARKLKSGSWNCTVFSHYETIDNPDGTTRKKRIYQSFTVDDPSPAGKKKCELMAAEWAFMRKDRAKHLTVHDAIRKYIDANTSVLSPSTINHYEQYLRNCYSGISDNYLETLTQQKVQVWISSFAKTHSAKYTRNVYGLLAPAVKMFGGPSFDISLPQLSSPDKYIPTDADIQTLIAHVRSNDNDELLISVCLAAFCSLRISEICALTRNDIFETGIRINKAMVQDKDRNWVIKPTAKTGSSDRIAQAPPYLIDLMIKKDGRIIKATPLMINNRFRRAVIAAKLPHFSFHALRHYYASIAHALQIPDQYILTNGGWKTDYVMKRVYRNALKDVNLTESTKLQNHFDDLI